MREQVLRSWRIGARGGLGSEPRGPNRYILIKSKVEGPKKLAGIRVADNPGDPGDPDDPGGKVREPLVSLASADN
jgi:hypothetical protein